MGTSSSKGILLWLFCGIFLLAGYAWGAPAGFTPEASIAISFPKATFNAGEETTAYITISGKTNGATIIATITGLGIAETTVDVSNGGGSVAVTVPSIAGNYSYSASATISGQAVMDSTTITVTANHPPVATNTTATTPEDTPCQLTFSATDPDNDTLTFSPESPYSYTPPADFNGEDIVYFTVSDGNGGIAEGTVTITVTPVNDAPVACDGEIATDEDIPVDISLFAYDVDGDDISYTVVTAPSHGTLSTIDPDTGETSYTPAADWYGTDTFTFKVNDGLLDSDTATVTIVVNPVGDRVTLTLVKYLLADGQDNSSVSLYVVDENDDPLPNETVTLSTTGGTLTDTTLITDANGITTTTLTSSTTVGAVSVTATIEDDEDAQTVTFFTFALQVSGAIAVPNSTPAMYAVGLGKEDEVVTVSLITTPDIDLTDAGIALDWDGGDGTEDDQRTVAKDASGQSSVSVELRGSEQSVEIVVVEVTGIVADSTPLSLIDDDSYSPGKKHAVTTWTATPNTNAALKATVSPDVTAVHAMYNQLLLWSGGQAGTTPDKRIFSRNSPSKTEITVECGESSDVVTAWVSKVNIAIAGVSDSQEDSVSATIYPNTDDDNFSATADPPFNGSDLDEPVVYGENDLVPITITIDAPGIGGILTLTHGSKVAIYRNADKSGELPSLTWNLSKQLDNLPMNDEIPPAQLWVEGREISTLLGDQEFTLTHTWGVSCSDTVTATVQARAGESEASIRVVSLGSNGEPGLEKYDPIGGMMYLALQIKLGPGERLEQSMSTVTVKAQDDYAYTGSPASFTATWNLGNASGWWELINPGTTQAQWVAASAAPNNEIGNRDGSLAKVYCYMKEWNTPFTPSLPFTPPMGHNGEHTLKIVQVNGVDGDELSFQHYVVPTWQTAYQKVVPPQKAVVRNLIIKDVSTSNGTIDYFKYDPDVDGIYNRPTINFTVEDDGDPHQYECYVWIQSTAAASGWAILNYGTAGVDGWMKENLSSPGSVSAIWDGSHEPVDWTGHSSDNALWGTYTFDIYAIEYDELRNEKDWFYLKWPYCLTISNDPENGHDAWIAEGDNNEEIRCFYKLSDYSDAYDYSNKRNPEMVNYVPIGGGLNELCSPIPGGVVIDEKYDGIEGEGLLAFTAPSIKGIPRVLFTAEDGCWREYRRDHINSRMLAVNKKIREHGYALSDVVIALIQLDALQHDGNQYYLNQEKLEIIRFLAGRYYHDPKWTEVCQNTLGRLHNTPEFRDLVERKCPIAFKIFTDPEATMQDPKTYEMIDILHLIAVLDATTSSHGSQPMSPSSPFKCWYTSQEVDEVASWAGDLQSSIRKLQTIIEQYPLVQNNAATITWFSKLLIGTDTEKYKILSKLGLRDSIGVKVDSVFEISDWLADIDGWNMGKGAAYRNDIRNDTKTFGWIFRTYYLTNIYTRYSTFVALLGGIGAAEAETYHMIRPITRDGITLDHTVFVGFKNMYPGEGNITNLQRDALSAAFVEILREKLWYEH